MGPDPRLKNCRKACVFALRLVPDHAFLAGLAGRPTAACLPAAGEETPLSSVLATLRGAVGEGCDSPESLAVRLYLTRSVSRGAACKYFVRKSGGGHGGHDGAHPEGNALAGFDDISAEDQDNTT